MKPIFDDHYMFSAYTKQGKICKKCGFQEKIGKKVDFYEII
jgi:uncharacterized protein (DUF983 family)